MATGHDFIESLKKMGYPDVASLDASSFDWMFEDKALVPFLETICFDIQEENVLSPHDITEYKAFQENEVLDISKVEKTKASAKSVTDEQHIQKETSELKEDIFKLEERIRLLEMQRDRLNVHELEIMGETNDLENRKKDFESEIRKIRKERLPLSQAKVLTTISASVQLLDELNLLLEQQPNNDAKNSPRVLFQVNIQPYLQTEMDVLECINTYLRDCFKKFDAKFSNLFFEDVLDKVVPEISAKELQIKQAAEALRLREIRQSIEEDNLKDAFGRCKIESQVQFYDELMEKNDLSAYNLPSVLLQNKLEKVQKCLKEMKEEEERVLLKELPKVVRDHLLAQYKWIAMLCSKEKLNRYKAYLELLQTPLDIIYEQRARLEFLSIALTGEEDSLKNIKDSVLSFKQKLEDEANESQQRLVQYAEQSKGMPKDSNCIGENSVLFILNEIMECLEADSNNQMLYLTNADVVNRAKKLKLYEESLIDESAQISTEQLKLLKTAEMNLTLYEKYSHSDKQNFQEHPLLVVDKFVMSTGTLSLGLQNFQEGFLKEMNNYLSKKEIISKNSNVALSRKLFVYALIKPEKFEKAIQEIKYRVEHYEKKKRAITNVK